MACNAALGVTSMLALEPFVAGLRPYYGQRCAPIPSFPLMGAMLSLLLPETKDCELLLTLKEGEAFGMKKTRRPVRENMELSDGVAQIFEIRNKLLILTG